MAKNRSCVKNGILAGKNIFLGGGVKIKNLGASAKCVPSKIRLYDKFFYGILKGGVYAWISKIEIFRDFKFFSNHSNRLESVG